MGLLSAPFQSKPTPSQTATHMSYPAPRSTRRTPLDDQLSQTAQTVPQDFQFENQSSVGQTGTSCSLSQSPV